MNDLATKTCKPCKRGSNPMAADDAGSLLTQLASGWAIAGEKHLEKEFRFPNFREALDFANKVGDIAEEEGHHPDMMVSWGKVKLSIWTHSVDGLTENDFILAAKVDAVQ